VTFLCISVVTFSVRSWYSLGSAASTLRRQVKFCTQTKPVFP